MHQNQHLLTARLLAHCPPPPPFTRALAGTAHCRYWGRCSPSKMTTMQRSCPCGVPTGQRISSQTTCLQSSLDYPWLPWRAPWPAFPATWSLRKLNLAAALHVETATAAAATKVNAMELNALAEHTACTYASASIAHLHCRDPKQSTGKKRKYAVKHQIISRLLGT